MSASVKKVLVAAGALLGALLLLVSLFLDWYEVKATEDLPEGITDSISFSGWTALEFADGFILFVVVAVIWKVVARLRSSAERDDVLLGALALMTTAVVAVPFFTKNSVLAMAVSAIDLAEAQPDVEEVPVAISTNLGAILALVGALALLGSALLDALVKPAAAPHGAPAGAGSGYLGPTTPAPQTAPSPAGMAPGGHVPQATQPAGWHPDPHGQGRERYWDGSQWTSHTR